MLLAFDVGNTDTKVGFFARDSTSPLGPEAAGPLALRRDWRVGTSRDRTADEFGILIATLLRSGELDPTDVRAIVVSSVVPQADGALVQACSEYLGHEPVFFTAATQTLIEVTTDRPRELGSDMLAAAVAARETYGTPLIVLGFGTATTFTAVSREGELLGTAIAPGIRISIDALVDRTAKLPQIALDAPNGPIGRDTVSAMQAGIIFGFVGQAEGLIARMKHAIGEDACVVATGGLAAAIAKHTAEIQAVEPHLVLDGLRIFYERTVRTLGRERSSKWYTSPVMPYAVAPLHIGAIEIWPPIVLAPMSGVTNRTLRALYKPFGFGLTVTEFVSSNALQHGNARTMEMIDQHGVEQPVSTQLWGNDPELMARAARLVRECGADIVDINFGCPAPKVVKTEGGSACLRDVPKCEAIMAAVVAAVDCPVTVKMRLGWTETSHVYREVAQRAEAVGVRAVTLHARTAKQFYKGNADWSHIAELKRSVAIPVIGNGDLCEPHEALGKMRDSGVDGVMLGRAVLGNPWLVETLRALMEGRDAKPVPEAPERLRFAVHHYRTMVAELGESRAVPQMRKHLGYYLKGFQGASELRERLMRTPTAAETLGIVEATIERLERKPVAA